MTSEILEELKSAYRSGIGFRDLCVHHNLSFSATLSLAKLESWHLAPKTTAKSEPPNTQITQAQAQIPLTPLEKGNIHAERMAKVTEKVLTHIEDLAEHSPEAILEDIDAIEKLDKVARRSYGVDVQQTGGPTLNVNILAQGIEAFATIQTPKTIDLD